MANKPAPRSSRKPATPFAARLAREMSDRELTYERFAGELGVSKSQLHDWVHGEHEPTLSTLRDVAKKLGCDVIELIEAA